MRTHNQTLVPATPFTPAKVFTEDGHILDATETWRETGLSKVMPIPKVLSNILVLQGDSVDGREHFSVHVRPLPC